MLNPVGNTGLALQEVTVPVTVGVIVAIAVLFLNVYELLEYVSADGAAVTVILIEAVVFPPALVAVIVCIVVACVTVGVPEIAHVVAFILSPVGNAGDALQDVTVPVTVGVFVVIAVF